jgi:IclR family pca regulon transcriptional regulator
MTNHETSSGSEQTAGGVRALERGLALLARFDVDHPSWTLAALSRAVGLHKATARRLAKTLEAQRFLHIDESTGEYRLGPAVLPLTYLARSNDELVRAAHLYVERLAELTQETVGLSIWTDGGIVQIDHVLTTHLFKPQMLLGSLSSQYGTTHSKIFLAFGPEERLSKLTWGSPTHALTVADATTLREELDRVREEGMAFDFEETMPGVCAVGVPIRDSVGEVVASMAVVVPRDRFRPEDQEHLAAHAYDAASALSRDLGFRGDDFPPPKADTGA